MDDSTSASCDCNHHDGEPRPPTSRIVPGAARRLFPPPRRRPHLLVVLGRWWFEIVLVAGLGQAGGVAAQALGTVGAEVSGAAVVVATGVAAACSYSVRTFLLACYQRMIVPHRVRAGMAEAGLRNGRGRMPAVVRAQCRADQARLWVHLPAGLIAEDLGAAQQVIAAACGAAAVVVTPDGARSDRVVLVVVRPRWLWPPL